MGPAPQTPRLADVDPVAFATGMYDLVIEHRRKEAEEHLAPGIPARREVPDARRMTESPLWLAAFRLAAYAKTGRDSAENVGDNWERAIGRNSKALAVAARGYLGNLGGALYGVAGPFEGGIPINVDTDGDPKTTLGVVLLATTGRLALYETGGRVSSRELAALASLSERRIRQVVVEGGLKRSEDDPEAIDAKSALAWLRARSVDV